MVNEINVNFGARQLVVMDENQKQIARFTDSNFTQFEDLQARIEQACVKTPEQIQAEKDKLIADLQKQKDAIDAQIVAAQKGVIT